MTGHVLVTGASGFIGRALVADLAAAGRPVRAAMRQPADVFARSVEVVAVSDLTRPVEWRALLKGIETVVHLAGIAHAGPEIAETAYDRVNRLATVELAEAAQRMGVRRLVFASSVRAQSGPVADRLLVESDPPQPTDAYGRSKLAAENALRQSGVPYTILRPVLVYGPGVKGNLARLLQLAGKPWPLPFGGFSNRRSVLARQNLVGAIHFALESPATAGETYLVADPEPVTLAEIVTAMRAGLGRRPGLVSIPISPLAMALKAAGRAETWERLGGDLRADPGKLLQAGWRPSVETHEGLAAMAREWRAA
jgi:nucleoside-diphosphate-sugar epimerase